MFERNTLLIVIGVLLLLAACAREMPDEVITTHCQDGEIRSTSEPCGIDRNGFLIMRCVAGQWVDTGECRDPAVCVEGDPREIPCGHNGNGTQSQKCLTGRWTDNGPCIDPDDCVNSSWDSEQGSVRECVYGHWVLRRTTRQWGTGSPDRGYGVAVDDAGNVFVTGTTNDTMDREPQIGSQDVFLTKWNADGAKAWTRVWGTDAWEQGSAVTVDAAGDIFVAGTTFGSLDGNINARSCDSPLINCTTDLFLTKWHTDGTKVWTKQWGTTGTDEAYALVIDASGNIYVTGRMLGFIDGNTNMGIDCDPHDAGVQPCAPIFLTKWDHDDTYAWTRQWGADYRDRALAVAVDASEDIFVTGNTNGDLEGNSCIRNPLGNCSGDIFLTKWNADGVRDGAKSWTHLWGTARPDQGTAVAVDRNGNIFVTGHSSGTITGSTATGSADIFLTKRNSEGSEVWTNQWGFLISDHARSIAIDAKGDILIAGSTIGSFDGSVAIGGSDIFLAKWHTDGTTVWSRSWGTTADDYGRSVTVDTMGQIFVAGFTEGPLDGNILLGATDVFLSIFPTDKTAVTGK